MQICSKSIATKFVCHEHALEIRFYHQIAFERIYFILTMEILSGQELVNKSKSKVSADEALKDKSIVAFYFSAHWCPPCRMFTPVLADFYEEVKDKGFPFEIIFVSSDRSEDALFDYMNEAHGDWLAVPFGSPIVEQLKKKFNVQGIPMLIVMKSDGTIVSTNGRSDVENKGVKAFQDWSI
ncbi:nucleoredoxin [Trichonephila inaurata madagascariensis]|uniref:Nucleoredoxin n=1 Tax=Trichonephila inaurata madagascariensis TaxID=2747483 RepID=A0A8X6IAB0_9ARAC|nr:nucleoredoxin [Trichonephila inaurata madagascariensis]